MRIKRLLSDKSGVSLIFVLAVMLLLMAIGVSAITAAGLNFGAGVVQSERTQLSMYVSSMERTVKAMLEENDSGVSLSGVQTLAGRLLKSAYGNGGGLYIIAGNAVTMTADSPDGNAKYEITLTGSLNVQIREPYDLTDWIEDPEDPEAPPIEVFAGRTEQSARINGEVTVTQTTTFTSPGGKVLSMTTVTVYSYSEGEIEERGFDAWDPDVYLENMIITNPGKWAVSKHV